MENSASLATGPDGSKRRVSYFFEPFVGLFVGQPTPLPYEPYPSYMTHNLIIKHDLHYQMEINRPILAGFSDFLRFHSPEYLQFLASATPMSRSSDPSFSVLAERFFDRDVDQLNRNDLNPISHGLFDYCHAYAGCSLSAAAKLNRHEADIAINWSGGMHRARSAMASGFFFVNDIVLAILELLKVFKRVLYVDIGFRHGDAVEHAFYDTDRVMTLSFHTFRDDFFPRNYRDRRELYSLNAPLKDCLGDLSLGHLFRPVIHKAMEVYQPEVIVLQSGADSLAADMFGTFNLRSKGHGDCLQYIRSFNVPLLVLGGGGSMPRHVARCWCYETAVAVGLGAQLEERLFANEFFIKQDPIPDLNTPRDIITTRDRLLQQLSQVIHVPSVQFQDTPSISQAVEPADVDMDLRNLKRSKLRIRFRRGLAFSQIRPMGNDVSWERRIFRT